MPISPLRNAGRLRATPWRFAACQQQLQIVKGALAEMESGDTVTLKKETLAQLVDAPSFEELKRESVIAGKKGIVAVAVQMNKHNSE